MLLGLLEGFGVTTEGEGVAAVVGGEEGIETGFVDVG